MSFTTSKSAIRTLGDLPKVEGFERVGDALSRALAERRLEHVAKAIWFAEWEEPFPAAGTIQHAMAMQMAVAATEALAQAMEMAE